MSLVLTISLSVLGGAATYSIYSKIKRTLSESLVYKDTPTLLSMYDELEGKYELARKQSCFGEMGRLSSKMREIKEEVILRSENTRMNNKLVSNH